MRLSFVSAVTAACVLIGGTADAGNPGFCADMAEVGALAAAGRNKGDSKQTAANVIAHGFSTMLNSREYKSRYSSAERKQMAASFGRNASEVVDLVYKMDRATVRNPEIVGMAVRDVCISDW